MDRAKVVFDCLQEHKKSPSIQFSSTAGGSADHDIVVCSALRTPICKAKRGGFKDTLPDDLLAAVFKALINDVGVDPMLIGDISVGNCLQQGAGAYSSRVAQFFSGIPESVPISAVNRLCSSGLQACMNIAGAITIGSIDIGIGAGVESMTTTPMGRAEGDINPKVFEHELAKDLYLPMGITAENVAARFNVTAVEQNQMAVDSHAKAHRAQKEGKFKDEIVPVQTVLRDADGNEKEVTISADDGIRQGTTLEKLAKLKPAFQEGGTVTAGNSSQVSDGAAAVLLARRSAARRHGLPVLGVLRGYAVVGVPPDIMGVGPAYAIPEALKKAGLKLSDIDIFEINEAFASQATYCVRHLNIPMEKVNPNGGGIALGHPLGCTGARQVGTLLHELRRRGKRAYGVVSMCIGTGMGAAAVFEYPGQ